MSKRPRVSAGPSKTGAPYKRPRMIVPRTMAPARTIPGYTRTVGAYGRSLPLSFEKKYFDTSVISTGDATAGVIIPSLNLIAQGTTDQSRVGNKITIRNINIHAYCNNDDQLTAAYAGSNVRVIVYLDKQTNGAAAGVTDLLKTAAITSFRNMDQVDRFVILVDKIVFNPVESANAAHTSNQRHYWSVNKKCNIPVHFSSTTGGITEVRSNNIGILYVTDEANANSAANGIARVKFTDD